MNYSNNNMHMIPVHVSPNPPKKTQHDNKKPQLQKGPRYKSVIKKEDQKKTKSFPITETQIRASL